MKMSSRFPSPSLPIFFSPGPVDLGSVTSSSCSLNELDSISHLLRKISTDINEIKGMKAAHREGDTQSAAAQALYHRTRDKHLAILQERHTARALFLKWIHNFLSYTAKQNRDIELIFLSSS